MSGNPKAVIIVVNFNGKRFLEDCLDSISRQSYTNYRTIVVDNGSTDGSVEFVKVNYPDVILIRNEENLGFAEGNNVGIREALKDDEVKFVALLNNDAIAERNWLKKLISIAEMNRVDMVASKIFLKDGGEGEKGPIHAVGVALKKECEALSIGGGEVDGYNTVMEVFAPHAAAALYSRDLLEDVREGIDYFDPSFFAYLEDADLAFRARLLGYGCLLSPKAIVYHYRYGTSRKELRTYHMRRNKLYLLLKDFPAKVIMRNFPKILLKEASWLGYAALRGELLTTLRAKLDAIKDLGQMLLKRRSIQARKKVSSKDVDGWLT